MPLSRIVTLYATSRILQTRNATIKDSYHLPHIQDTLDTLHGNNLFSTLDLQKGYHQIKVEESSRKKTAFTAHVGLFQYICLPFGQTNARASFQCLLEHVLQYYTGKFVIPYFDDILIFSSTFEDYLSHVTQVLQTVPVVPNASLLRILSSFWATSLPLMELGLTKDRSCYFLPNSSKNSTFLSWLM